MANPSKSLSGLALSPLIKIGEIDIGVDKLEHMFGSGHRYYHEHYEKQMAIEKVLSRGVTLEKTILGGNFVATGVFSYADLSANFNGMRFWNNILMKQDDILGAQYNRGPYVECVNNQWKVNHEKPIDFTHYVDSSFDESINCSKIATKNGLKKITKEVNSEALKDVVKCDDNHEKILSLSGKYSAHGINRFILNYADIKKVRYFGEIKNNKSSSFLNK